MAQPLFLITLSTFSALYLAWGVTRLPAERWQIAAAVPLNKAGDGSWGGVNLTWYGVLTANAYLAATALALLLMGAAGISLRAIVFLVVLLLLCCVPASRLVAQVVEKKANTFTVGGAVFIGTLVAPWIVELVNRLALGDQGDRVPPLVALSAISIAYAFGEGFGRLACLSFGCCYGKALSHCHPRLARLLAPLALTFTGKTKKIAYASQLDGVKVVPVQALTYVLYCGAGLAGCILFLAGSYAASFLVTLAVTQAWRVVSELLRDDYRGAGRISAYQIMGILGIAYGFVMAWLFGDDRSPAADLANGWSLIWSPGTLLALQLLWLVIFLYTGLSRVTAATLRFHVEPDKV
ncbi:prolipoprotein diacylglyceryl transferase family protein [Geomonas silvestris]|nr:prolipoprotein diacylglyceryl transferase family protein [Geomonas silvestris]